MAVTVSRKDQMDLTIAVLLAVWFPQRVRIVLLAYWCSPLVFYVVYWHGQLDLLPTALLMVSFYFKQAGEHSGCEFLHKSFREYLAAEGIIEVLKTYGRMCQTSRQEKPASEYWREFDSGDPRYWLTRKLGEILGLLGQPQHKIRLGHARAALGRADLLG